MVEYLVEVRILPQSRRLIERAVFISPDCATIRAHVFVPSIPTLCFFRSTRNESGNCTPILVTVRLCWILQVAVFICLSAAVASTHCADIGTQDFIPSLAALSIHSTRNQFSNCDPIHVTVRLYYIPQLAVFVCCPFTRTSIRPDDVGIQDMVPSVMTLHFFLTWNQRGPILATVRFYRSIQLGSSVYLPVRPVTFKNLVDAEIQGIMPPVLTLHFRSTWNQRGNCGPILATVHLYRILQLAVFIWFPFTRTSFRLVDAGIQDTIPSVPTLL
jgi:hypothetical protein